MRSNHVGIPRDKAGNNTWAAHQAAEKEARAERYNHGRDHYKGILSADEARANYLAVYNDVRDAAKNR